jgi:hypothetical protein
VNEASIGPEGRVSVPGHVRFRRFDDEVVLLDLEGGQYFALNAAAASMWTSLAEGRTPLEVASIMSTEFDVDLERLVVDCIALADDLIRQGLMERR